MIPYGRQDISEADIAAVAEVLRSDFLTQGPVVPQFEAAVAARCGVDHAVAVNSATSALHLACLALGLGPGGLVWTSPITFAASANAALYCGAQADFVDIDPRTGNLCPAALRQRLETAAMAGRLPSILIPVHLAGQSAEMAEIGALARSFGVRVIEDASHAIGGQYRGQPVGACLHSDITVFSFHPVKIVTTGEGGMALTCDPALAARMALLRSHGITRDATLMEAADPAPWHYEQQALGFNYRMTDIAAALGLSQLSRLEAFVQARAALADRYDRELAALPLVLPGRHADAVSAHHLYVVRLRAEDAPRHRAVFEGMRAAGIGVNLHYIPVYRHPHYRRLREDWGPFPEAEAYYGTAISLPLYPGLKQAEQDHVTGTLARLLDAA